MLIRAGEKEKRGGGFVSDANGFVSDVNGLVSENNGFVSENNGFVSDRQISCRFRVHFSFTMRLGELLSCQSHPLTRTSRYTTAPSTTLR